jgi:hypothetical protein
MNGAPPLEQHRVLAALLALGVLVLVGWVSGAVIGTLLVRLIDMTLGVVSGGS